MEMFPEKCPLQIILTCTECFTILSLFLSYFSMAATHFYSVKLHSYFVQCDKMVSLQLLQHEKTLFIFEELKLSFMNDVTVLRI